MIVGADPIEQPELAMIMTAAGYSATEAALAILRLFPETTLNNLPDYLLKGSAGVDKRFSLAAINEALAEAVAKVTVTPPPPAVDDATVRWQRPLAGNGSYSDLQYCSCTKAIAKDRIVVAGEDVLLLDTATGGVVAAMENHRLMAVGDGVVYLHDPSASNVVAVDADGATLWKTAMPFGLAAVGETSLFVIVEGMKAMALDLASGQQLWAVASPGSGLVARGAVASGGGKFVYMSYPSPTSIELVALDQATGSESWRWTLPPLYESKPVAGMLGNLALIAGTVFVAANLIYFIDVKTGAQPENFGAWKQNSVAADWAVDPDRHLFIVGTDDSVAFIASYALPSSIAPDYFPDLITAKHPPGTGARSRPRMYGTNAIIVFDPVGRTQVEFLDLGPALTNAGVPHRPLFSIATGCTQVQVRQGVLYHLGTKVLDTGPDPGPPIQYATTIPIPT